MKNSAWIVVFPGLVSALALAQTPPPPPKRLAPPSAQLSITPVTRAEAREVMKTMEERLSHALHLPYMPAMCEIPDSPSPVTRSEVIREFNRVFEEYKSAFKFTPAKLKFDASQITLKDPAEKPALLKLISWGFVGKIGPIAAGPTPTLTIHQFGDGVGFFMSRVADLCHTPISKYTPYLNGGRG